MNGHLAWQKLMYVARASVCITVLLLTACEPEQTPASAARTAAALRTPASAPVQTTPQAGPTLAAAAQSTPQTGTTTAGGAAATGAAAKPATEAQSANLTASPNPVPFTSGKTGSTTIRWNTAQTVDGQVFVSEDGSPEKLFASGISGQQDAPWIKPAHRYDFRLYAGTSHGEVLATVTVGSSSPGTLAPATANPVVTTELGAAPNPVPADDRELGSTVVTWTTGGGGEIYVSQDGDDEKLFASGIRGSEAANWICRGSTYEFRLYAAGQHDDPLKIVTVTRADDEPDHQPPPVVECKTPADQGLDDQ